MTQMKYRKLGNTGLKVSEISLGSWLTAGTLVEKETAGKTIEKAYDLGINFFDTANVYGHGEAEKIVGATLKQFRRESFVLATKVFWPMGVGPNDRGLSRKHVYEQAHLSLKRLGVDYIDLYYCHRFDPDTPIEETLRTIEDLVRQGKVLYVGVSEWSAAQISEALHTADRSLLDRIVVHQPNYNMLNRKIEKETIPFCEKNGIAHVVFSPLAQGVLTGKYKLGQPIPSGSRAADPRSENKSQSVSQLLTDDILGKVEQLQKVADERETTLSQLAIAWILRLPNIASAIIGASKPEQVEENVKALDVQLDEVVIARIDSILNGNEG